MKVKMLYPYTSFSLKEVDVTEEQFEEIQNMSDAQKADFILKNIEGDDEFDWTNTILIEGALDVNYAWIRKSN